MGGGRRAQWFARRPPTLECYLKKKSTKFKTVNSRYKNFNFEIVFEQQKVTQKFNLTLFAAGYMMVFGRTIIRYRREILLAIFKRQLHAPFKKS